MFAIGALAFSPPPMNGRRVNDYAGILKPDEVSSLEQSLKDYEAKTSNQICVLTVASLQDETIESYANQTFHAWKLGQKGKDNGVLLLIQVGEKNNARIEVGYGLEGVLPDGTARLIINNDMRPEFKAKHYYASINAGILAMERAIGGEYKAPAAAAAGIDPAKALRRLYSIFWAIGGLVVMIIGHFLWRPLGGIVGGAAAFWVTYAWTDSLILAIVAGIVGFLIGYFLRELGEGISDSSGSSGYSSSGGAWTSSSSGSGSDESFRGGGDSGGGGASGSLD